MFLPYLEMRKSKQSRDFDSENSLASNNKKKLQKEESEEEEDKVHVHRNISMLKLWKWYQNCLTKHPIRTEMVSSGLIWGIGDIAAQKVTHTTARNRNPPLDEEEKERLRIDWRRVAKTTLFGIVFVGPVGHFWYEWLDSFIRHGLKLRPGSFRFIAAKVALDVMIFGPMDLFLFFAYMGFSSGKSASQVKEDMKRDFVPTVILEGALWPFVQVVNFRFVPVQYQLLYVNVFCLLDSCFLSWVEQQEDALPWKDWLKSILPAEDGDEEEQQMCIER